MRPYCRTTSTSTSWIGLRTMSSRSDWGIASTCGMHVEARYQCHPRTISFLRIEERDPSKQVYHSAGHQALRFGGGRHRLFRELGAAWHPPGCRD